MARPKTIQIEKSAELIRAEEKVKEIREKERKTIHLQKAKQTLENIEKDFHNSANQATTLDEIYNICKDVFFAVNGARRVLKAN